MPPLERGVLLEQDSNALPQLTLGDLAALLLAFRRRADGATSRSHLCQAVSKQSEYVVGL